MCASAYLCRQYCSQEPSDTEKNEGPIGEPDEEGGTTQAVQYILQGQRKQQKLVMHQMLHEGESRLTNLNLNIIHNCVGELHALLNC